MIGTENKLWDNIGRAAKGTDCNMNRIETTTRDGVSDIEYVAQGKRKKVWHGWIELKTSSAQKDSSKLTLHTPYTPAQVQWLLDHDNPEQNMRSWLLIGRVGVRTWKEYLLITPRASVMCMQFREVPRVADVYNKQGVIRCATAHEVIQVLKGEVTLREVA